MKFSKLPSTIEEQSQLLTKRGMHCDDPENVSRWLKSVGYYRLSAYWLPFEHAPDPGRVRSKRFVEGTTFEKVTGLYVFDRKLRLLLLEAIERIEIHLRSSWTYHLAHAHGAHAHLNHELYRGGLTHPEQLAKLARAVEKSEEVFIQHYRKKYTEPYSPPLWAVTELMSFGELSKWFQATKDSSLKSMVARELGLPTQEVAEGTLQAISYVRNICAHHGRLWNRRMVKRLPKIKRLREDIVVERIGEQRQPENFIYNTIVVLLYLLDKQATDSTYLERLRQLVETVDDSDREKMGFPEDWRSRPAWN